MRFCGVHGRCWMEEVGGSEVGGGGAIETAIN